MAVAGGAGATHTLLDYDSAVDALNAVDPTIQPASSDSGKDFAIGGFQGPIGNNFGVSAHSGPLGEDAQGHLSETIPGVFQGRFRVTCLAVALNQAAIGLVPTAASDQQAQRVVALRDNPRLLPDQFAVIEGELANTCELFVADAEFFVERGNIVVHDAMP